MYLSKIVIKNFRNIADASIEFDEKVNIITGDNGQGKTSVLEAIYYLGLTKSFRANKDFLALKHKAEYFFIEGIFESQVKGKSQLRVYFSDKEGKNLFYNKNRINRYSEIIGMIPVILLSLEDVEITYGTPQRRRRFLDILLSQVSPQYLQALQFYRRSLLNRNKLLSEINAGLESIETLLSWDEQLAKYGAEILLQRLKFVDYLNERLSGYYRKISVAEETVAAQYKTSVNGVTQELTAPEIKEIYSKRLANTQKEDIQKMATQVGPHRDDVLFLKNGYLFKSYGSQGENKTFLIALKFVESEYLYSSLGETPLFLLDDIFGELDKKRIQQLMIQIENIGQTFITTTLESKFDFQNMTSSRILKLHEGQI